MMSPDPTLDAVTDAYTRSSSSAISVGFATRQGDLPPASRSRLHCQQRLNPSSAAGLLIGDHPKPLTLGNGQLRGPQGPEQWLGHDPTHQGKRQQDKPYTSPQRNTIFPGHQGTLRASHIEENVADRRSVANKAKLYLRPLLPCSPPSTKRVSTQPDRLSRTIRLPGEVPVRAFQDGLSGS